MSSAQTPRSVHGCDECEAGEAQNLADAECYNESNGASNPYSCAHAVWNCYVDDDTHEITFEKLCGWQSTVCTYWFNENCDR
jgi:hypothetical protein